MGLLRKIGQLLGNFTTYDGVIVLTYHRVNDKLAKDSLVVDPKEFARQMLFLSLYRKCFEVIDLVSAIAFLAKAPSSLLPTLNSQPSKTKVLITFDDGYRDNYLHAFPILKRHKFPATIFLTTGRINGGNKEYLNTDEINEMVKAGITFGTHTQTHPHLSKISIGQVKDELTDSYRVLKAIAGSQDIPFCYPYGDYNEDVKKMVREAGFSCAFSVKPGINYPGQDIFEIKRIDVLGDDNFSSFKYKITDKYSREP